MLVWTLAMPTVSWAAVVIAAVTFLAAVLLFVRAALVSAIADSDCIRFQGVFAKP